MLNVTLVTTPTRQQYTQALADFKANQNNVWVSVAFTGFLGHIKNFTL
jgi:hypothetical protein